MSFGGRLDTQYWKRVDELLQTALAITPAERGAWLERLDGEDEPLKPVLAGMLARADDDSGFMGEPVAAASMGLDELAPDKPGDIVGPYKLLWPFGTGGMGTVWCAELADGSLQRQVALKLPPTGWSPGLAGRLERESRILATLEHPNVARLYDAGLTGTGRPYLAMEGIVGLTIVQHCLEHKLAVRERLRLFLQVARAVAYAHGRLVVHRDLKPANILVDNAGVAHVVDFGIAKLLDATAIAPSDVSQAYGRALTPDYASPEQIRGDVITVASDIYSLGVVLYELLTGFRPYRLKRATAAALEEAIAEAHVPPPSTRVVDDRSLARALRGDLDTIVERALRKSPSERYPTVDALAADIQRHLAGEPVLARPDAFLYRAGKFVRRHRTGVSLAGVVVAVGALGIGGVFHQSQVAKAERDKALAQLRYAEAAEEFTRFLLGEQAGQPIAPQELLGRAREAVVGQFADDPALRARMQLVLSELYGELSDLKHAESLLRDVRESARAGGDASALAQAECALGSILGTTGREKEATELFAANIPTVDARAEIDPRAFQVCHAWRGNFRRNRGMEGAGTDFELASRSMEASGSMQRTARIRLKASIADSLGSTGRMPEALRIYEEASSELARIGRANTSSGWTLTNNYLFNLVRAGHLRKAEEVYLRAVPESRAQAPPTDLAIAFGRMLVDFGRLDEAERLLAVAAEEKARVGHVRGEAYALQGLARASCARGVQTGCDAAITRARARFEKVERPGHSAYAVLEYARGQAFMERGDVAGARAPLEEAVRLFNSAPDRNPMRVRAMSLLALCLGYLGEPDAARRFASQAVDTAREFTAGLEESEWVGSALLHQAAVHDKQGEAAAARASLAEAMRHLSTTLGTDAPILRRWDSLVRKLAPADHPLQRVLGRHTESFGSIP